MLGALSIGCAHAAGGTAFACQGRSEAEGAPDTGLVHSSTKGTARRIGTFETSAAVDFEKSLIHANDSGFFEVDRMASRLLRMSKGVKTAARLMELRLHSEHPGVRWKALMITLTYREITGWQANHINDFRRRVAEHLRRRGLRLRWVWVMELQKRGAPHYHVLVWLPRSVKLPKPDKAKWWTHGLTKIEWARNAVGYIAKYASKMESHGVTGGTFPKGARLHGVAGLELEQRNTRTWWMMPGWVRDHWPNPQDKPRPALGGGYSSRITGEWQPSPWEVLLFGGSVLIKKREVFH